MTTAPATATTLTPQIDDASARAAIAELAADGLLALTEADALGFTDAGRVLYEQINGAVNEVISWAHGNIPAEDLATAGRVLTEITSKLNSQSAVK